MVREVDGMILDGLKSKCAPRVDGGGKDAIIDGNWEEEEELP